MSVRSEILAFLKQRRSAATRGVVVDSFYVKRRSENLLMAFDKIRETGEWRHLREIYNQRDQIQKLLPSPDGKHAAIRERIEALITKSISLASKPRNTLIVQANKSRLNKNRYDEEKRMEVRQ